MAVATIVCGSVSLLVSFVEKHGRGSIASPDSGRGTLVVFAGLFA